MLSSAQKERVLRDSSCLSPLAIIRLMGRARAQPWRQRGGARRPLVGWGLRAVALGNERWIRRTSGTCLEKKELCDGTIRTDAALGLFAAATFALIGLMLANLRAGPVGELGAAASYAFWLATAAATFGCWWLSQLLVVSGVSG